MLTLGGENAAKLLLGAVQALPSTSPANAASATRRSEEKERGIYAAVFDSKPEHPLDLSQARHVSQVMAGDPSRGAVSVETEEEVREGYFIAVSEASAIRASPNSPHIAATCSFCIANSTRMRALGLYQASSNHCRRIHWLSSRFLHRILRHKPRKIMQAEQRGTAIMW